MWKENRLKRIDSTQKEAIRRIKTGKINKPEFFYSFDQFDGYGTHGRKWEKSKESLAISFAWPKLLTPKLDKIIFPIIFSTFVVEDIEKFMNYPKYSLGLKWPNDLMKEEKKIGGVLVQTINQNLEEWFVVGLGINLFWCPLDFNHSYGSLLTNNDECFPKDELVSTVFETMRKIFLINSLSSVTNEFNKRDIFRKKQIKIRVKGIEFVGKNCGISDNGGILLQDKYGKIRVFQTGNLSIL